MATTKFDKVKAKEFKSSVSGDVVAQGTPHAKIADGTLATAAASAISASSNDADGAKLADVQALRTTVNNLRTELAANNTKFNQVLDALEEFGINLNA